MRSSLPKVLHPVAGQSLLAHVLEAAPHGAGAALAVVVGPGHTAVVDEVARVSRAAREHVEQYLADMRVSGGRGFPAVVRVTHH